MYHHGSSSERRIAVVKWAADDEIAEAIYNELGVLGYRPTFFLADSGVPADHSTIFSYGPYGKLILLVQALASLPAEERPLLAHWNTEGLPDLRLPWRVTRVVGAARSWLDRVRLRLMQGPRRGAGRSVLSFLDTRMLRFRYIGDYYYAFEKGILNVLSDSSAVYSDLRNREGLPTVFAPWGSVPRWYRDLDLERDIDVLWMGTRKSRRRRTLIDSIRQELGKHGVQVYMADNEENPFIFGEERIRFLNRAKITLNVTRTWYDDNFSRFAIAAPNRSLIVSESMLGHCPAYQPGVHYVEDAPEAIAQRILTYLQHPAERARIVENAYRLTTSQLTFANTVKTIMKQVEAVRQWRQQNEVAMPQL